MNIFVTFCQDLESAPANYKLERMSKCCPGHKVKQQVQGFMYLCQECGMYLCSDCFYESSLRRWICFKGLFLAFFADKIAYHC